MASTAARSGAPLFLRSLGASGSLVAVLGLTRVDLVSTMPVLEASVLDSSPFMQSFSRLDPPLPVFQASRTGPAPPLRHFAHFGFLPFICSLVRFSSSASCVGQHLGAPPSPHGPTKVGSLPPALGHTTTGPSSPLHCPAWAGSMSPTTSAAHPDLSPLAHSLG